MDVLAQGHYELVSVSSQGEAGRRNDYYDNPGISDDGRYVVFASPSDVSVEGDTNKSVDIFVHDRQTHQTRRISAASDGSQTNGGSYNPSISSDGNYVVFSSIANNLVSNDSNKYWDIFVHDLRSGETELVSVSFANGSANGDSGGWGTDNSNAISADGRYIAFSSYASNLTTLGGYMVSVYLYDRQTRKTVNVSVDTKGRPDKGYNPAISADGSRIVFRSA